MLATHFTQPFIVAHNFVLLVYYLKTIPTLSLRGRVCTISSIFFNMDHKIILNQISNNNRILYDMLKEEDEDDELLFNLTNQKINQISPLFSRRKSE